MRRFSAAITATILVTSAGNVVAQPSQSPQVLPSTSVPRLINITGVFRPADGGRPQSVEEVTLAVYSEEAAGVPLWQETQGVAVDPSGRYTLLLGATETDGVPLHVFASGEARWLEMIWSRGDTASGRRTRLTSVPYALKAADAETLGGRPASAYMVAPSSARKETIGTQTTAGDAAVPLAVNVGTPNLLAKYVNANDVGASSVYEAGGRVGVNTDAPLDIIHSRFSNGNGALTGLAVQNLANTATSFSGMLFYDQNGALGQFQGFNNVTHEYRINNIARHPISGSFDGSINFMIGGASRFRVDPNLGISMFGPAGILAGAAPIGLLVSSSGDSGISVQNTNLTGTAVFASGPSGSGVFGSTDSGTAVVAFANTSGDGVFGSTDTGTAVAGFANDIDVGWAGVFDGDVNVLGNLFKGGGAFKIDHPLDPENKYLSHSFVESPDMKNIYDGVAVFDGAGEATVSLPEWFEALNKDFRYQLTPMGAAFVPYVSEEIARNQFKIAGGIRGKKVSWQVTGIRHDAFANANRIAVEETKPAAAVGTYLHPEAFGHPAAKGRGNEKTAAAEPSATPVATRGNGQSLRKTDELKARLRTIGARPSKQ
jgi:hypothetical protein